MNKLRRIINDDASVCLEELRTIHKEFGDFKLLKILTPSDTYEYDENFNKFPEPKHMTKFGILIELEK